MPLPPLFPMMWQWYFLFRMIFCLEARIEKTPPRPISKEWLLLYEIFSYSLCRILDDFPADFIYTK